MQNMQYRSKIQRRATRGAWLLALLGLLLFPIATQAGELTARGGVVLFSELDGSSVDGDGVADGVLTLDRLDLAGNAELRVDVIPARIQVAGDVDLAGASAIRPAPGLGAPDVELEAVGSIRLTGNSAIVADAPQGGDLVLCAGGDLVLAGKATVSANAGDLEGAGGSVYLEAAGRLVLADAAVRVLANGADGGAVTLVSCGTGDAGPGSSNRNAALAVDGVVEAVGADGVGGTVEVEARQGEVAFGPGRASIDARGTAADGAVAITSAGRVLPASPPVEPQPVVVTDAPSDEPCECSTGAVPVGGLVVAADVDRPTGLPGTLFTFSGRVVQGPAPVVDWQWVLSDGRTFGDQSISVSFPEPGLYGATLTAVDEEGTVLESETGVVVFDPATQAPPEMNLPDQVGDLDLDGLVTLEDAHRVAKHAGELELLSGGALDAADVDLDGEVSDRDARLLGRAVAAGAPLPTALLPERGAPGTRVNLISPELLDPTALVQVEVGESSVVQTPLRPVRGYATFLVPFDATVRNSIRVEPGPVEVRVLKDGVVVHVLTFQVEEPQPLPADPKAELISFLDDYVQLFELNRQAVAGLLDLTGTGDVDVELLLASYTAAQQDVAAKVADLKALLEKPGGDELAELFFLYANTEGYADFRTRLDEQLAAQTAIVAELRIAAASGTADVDLIVDALCAVKDAGELLKRGSDILSTTCDGLLAAAIIATLVPLDGPIADAALWFSWATTCGGVEATVELASLITSLVADLNPDLRFDGDPTAPGPGESVQLRARVEIVGADDICSYTIGNRLDEFIEDLAEEAIERLFRKKVVLRSFSKAIELLSEDIVDELEDRLEAAVVRAVSYTAVGDMLGNFADTVCDFFLQVGPSITDDLGQIMEGPSPDVGTLTFNGDGTATYTCPTDPNNTANQVHFTATRELCDGPVEETVTVSCETKPVTITIGDNGNLNDDIFEVRIEGETVLTSSAPTRAISTTVELAVGDHVVEMIGRAAPDGIGTYYITFSGATVIGGDATSGTDLTPGVVKTFLIRVQ